MKTKQRAVLSNRFNVNRSSKELKYVLVMLISIVLFACSNDDLEQVNTVVEKSKDVIPAEGKSKTGKQQLSYKSLKKWMDEIPDYTDITKITIPGTHNSGARFDLHSALQNAGKTQNLKISEQLDRGVRYLDIRCKIKKNNLAIYHGRADQKQTLGDVLNVVEKFLKENPSEFIFLSIKKEEDKDSSADFERLVKSNFSSSKYWNRLYKNNNGFPCIRDVRGKIVLIKRFSGFSDAGYSAHPGWKDDSKNFTIKKSSYSLNVQDAYNVSWTDDKVKNIKNQLARSGRSTDKNELFLNFYSGYKKMFGGIPNVRSVSSYVNPKLDSYVKKSEVPKSNYGICILDFIDESLCKTLVKANVFEVKQAMTECAEF